MKVFAREIIHVLRLFHIHAGLTERKEEYVVYLKEGDAVTVVVDNYGCPISTDGI